MIDDTTTKCKNRRNNKIYKAVTLIVFLVSILDSVIKLIFAKLSLKTAKFFRETKR